MIINNIYSVLPGVVNVKYRYKFFQDFLVFLIFTALPTSFYGFISKSFFIDNRMLFILAGIILLILNLKHLTKFIKLPLAKFYLLICCYLIFRIFYSLFFDNISLIELLKVIRTNFHYPITVLGFLLYVFNMNIPRIHRFLHWIFRLQIFLSLIYLINIIFKLNIYSVITKEDSLNYIELGQNMAAIPEFIHITFVFGLVYLINSNVYRLKTYQMIIYTITVIFIAIVRNQLVVFILSFILIVFLNFFRLKLNKLFRIISGVFIASLIITFFFNKNLVALGDKFQSSGKVFSTEFLNEGTYYFRLNLIKEAIQSIELNENKFFGNGYKRESEVQTYDYVMGDDTLVAAVLFTEGYSGLILRVSFLLFILIYCTKMVFSKQHFLFGVVFFSILIPEIINLIQTKIFTKYTVHVFFIFLLLTLYKKHSLIQQSSK